MAGNQVLAGPLGEIRAATVDGRSTSYAAGGHALTTAAKSIQLPPGTRYVYMVPRNFSTAVVVRYALNPWLAFLKTTDNFATTANATDASDALQDADDATILTLSGLDTLANSNALYVGSHIPFRGVSINVVAANSNSSILTVKYWDGSAWTDISVSDGTANGGATLAQDGNATWAVPAAWTPASLRDIATVKPAQGASAPYLGTPGLYWTRWEVSVALDASTTICNALALGRSTNYAELTSTDAVEFTCDRGPRGIGNIEALTDAGTANLIVNVGAGFSAGARLV